MKYSQTTPDVSLLDHFETYGSGLSIGIAAVLVVAAVVLRYFFAYSNSAFDEITRYLVIWGTMLGASRLVRKGGHVTVDILVVMLRPQAKAILQCVALALGVGFCILLTWLGGKLCWQSYTLDARSASVLAFPMWLPQAAIPVGAGLMAIRFLQTLAIALRQIRPIASSEEAQ